MIFTHTNRPGFWFGFIDFFTAGLFFLFYMPLGGLQDELDYILGRRTQRYWVAYLLGIPTLFIYTLVWMANIAEELRGLVPRRPGRPPLDWKFRLVVGLWHLIPRGLWERMTFIKTR